jgi:hypothetical protein
MPFAGENAEEHGSAPHAGKPTHTNPHQSVDKLSSKREPVVDDPGERSVANNGRSSRQDTVTLLRGLWRLIGADRVKHRSVGGDTFRQALAIGDLHHQAAQHELVVRVVLG